MIPENRPCSTQMQRQCLDFKAGGMREDVIFYFFFLYDDEAIKDVNGIPTSHPHINWLFTCYYTDVAST